MQSHAEAVQRALIESTDDLIWSVDRDYRLLTFNGALRAHFESIHGVRLEPGMLPKDLVSSQRAGLLPPLYERALTTGSCRVEFSLANDRILDLSLSPILLDGRAIGVSVFGKDITDRKLAEQAAFEAERKYRHIFEGASEGMFQTAFDGQSYSANPALAKMLGYSSPEEASAAVKDLARDVWVDPSERSRYIQQLETHGAVLGFESEFKRKDGTSIWVSISCRKIIAADGMTCFSEGFIQDISERRRTAQELRESRDSLREAQAIGGMGSYVLDFQTGIWTSSIELDEIFGIDEDYVCDVAGWASLVHPDDRDMMVTYFTEEVAGKKNRFDKEYRILRPSDQAVLWVHGQGRLEFDAQGQPSKMRGVIRDITAHKLVDVQLRESEERFRATFEQAAVGIVHTAFDGSFLRCNRRFAEIIGYLQKEVPGLTFQQITAPDDLSDSEEIRRQMAAGLRNDAAWEKRYRRRDGKLTWVKVTTSVQHDAVGHPVHNVSVVEDINDRKAAEERLGAAMEAVQTSEAYYRTIFQTSVDGIAISRLDDGSFIDVNKAFLETMGYAREEVIGRTSIDLGLWPDAEFRAGMAVALRESGSVREQETQICTKEGKQIWVQFSCSLMEMEGVPSVLTVVRNVTEARNAAEQLAAAEQKRQTSEARYRTAFHTSLDAVCINRLSDGMYVEVNNAFCNITGYRPEDVIGHSDLELNLWGNPRERERMTEMLRDHGSCRGLEARFRKKTGELVWGQMSASTMEIDGVPHILSVTRDITDAKMAEEEIRSLAFYDVLTHLPNRRLASERLRQALSASIRSNCKGALLFIDLDNFKRLNDTLGHQTGDLLLQEVARRVVTCTRDADIVARLGGDEFVVILEDLSEIPEEAAAHGRIVARKILVAVSQAYMLAGRDCLSTCSIGVAVFGDRMDNPDSILQQADIAMYQAKAAGRNTVRFFAPALQAAINARALLEENLREAIAMEQFQLYYQPQVDSGVVVGVEALLRWNHPALGVRLPGEFIALAEDTGMILPLGRWVIEAACTQIARWLGRKETARLSISVNISARQLREPDFVEQVLGLLSRTGANPCNLKFELTESMLVDNVEEVVSKMTILKSHGVRFSIDDFGIGYSSLAYLKRFPLDEMKIDRAFVRDMLVDITSGAIAQAIISLSHAMGLSVVAEGVETEAQREYLARMNCSCFQGDLFSKPMPLDELDRVLVKSTVEDAAECSSIGTSPAFACLPETTN